MGSKKFESIHDFLRWGMHLHLTCRNGHCDHFGIVDAHDASAWFRVHRWPASMDSFMGKSALDHFRCSRCGAKAGAARPTEQEPTVVDFFPADERGWRMLVRRLRG